MQTLSRAHLAAVSPPTLVRTIIAAAILLLAIGLRLAPRPAAQVLACELAPSPALCDLALVPLVGAENVTRGWPAMQPPDDRDRARPAPR